MLVMAGLVEEAVLRSALVEQITRKIPVGRLLVARGAVAEEDMALLLGRQLGLEMVDVEKVTPEPAALARIERRNAISWGMLPLRTTERVLEVALAEPDDRRLDEVRLALGLDVRPQMCSASQLERALERWYPRDS